MKQITRGLAAAAAGALAGLFAVTAASASTPAQFTARIQSRTMLLTSERLHAGEVIRAGLDGKPFRITSEQFNGGGTVAWIAPLFPQSEVGRVVVFTIG